MSLGAEDEREERPALVPSLFPLIPPTLYFSTANEKGPDSSLLSSTVSSAVVLEMGKTRQTNKRKKPNDPTYCCMPVVMTC